ncbi:MAG: DNA-directed RNA polymerase subunit omega [Pyrinomonadaceae bacterium]|nr:DNA-directed RNA polymerase subunit omega [Pyrinomonadaceae bacterium]
MADFIDETDTEETIETNPHHIDSKYRLILIAAQRSKQLQRGARPRVAVDTTKNKKNTRIALDEIKNEKIDFKITKLD